MNSEPAIIRQTSIGPAIISEFNPVDGQRPNLDLENKAKDEKAVLHEVLRDNFLKTQMSLGSTGNLMQQQDMKSVPGSPKGAVAKTARQQLAINGMSVGKNRRVTSSVSATSMPRLQNQNSPQVTR